MDRLTFVDVDGFSEYSIGKQVFLTKEAAEAALASWPRMYGLTLQGR